MRNVARQLVLPNDVQVTLPLLVPSFSSKGFPTFEDKDLGHEVSDSSVPFRTTRPILDESFLISAFDIHHGYIPIRDEDLSHTEIILIDSGGYELSPFFDSTEPVHHPYPKREFSLKDYQAVLNALDEALPLIVASPDWATKDKSLEEQVAFAQEFLSPYPFAKSLVLKPGDLTYVRIPKLAPIIERLNAFDVIGITEKELGRTLKERVKTVSELRFLLDRNGLSRIPIHVWGGLDPVITPLFFFAGAEIFDGLSWLRYAFHQGTAVYRDAKQILEGRVGQSFEHSRTQLWFENLSELRRLTGSLRMFDSGGRTDFASFEWHGGAFRRAFDELAAEMPELRRTTNGR